MQNNTAADFNLDDNILFCRKCDKYVVGDLRFCTDCGTVMLKPKDIAARRADIIFLCECIVILLACIAAMSILNDLAYFMLAGAAALILCITAYLLRPLLSKIFSWLISKKVLRSTEMQQAGQYIEDALYRMELALNQDNLTVFAKLRYEYKHLSFVPRLCYLDAIYDYRQGHIEDSYEKCYQTFLNRKGNVKYLDLLTDLVVSGAKIDMNISFMLRSFTAFLNDPKYTPLLAAIAETEYDCAYTDMNILDLAIKFTNSDRFKMRKFYFAANSPDPQNIHEAYGLGISLFENNKHDEIFVKTFVDVIKLNRSTDETSNNIVSYYYNTF
ncbi:MAG: hypothetical protein PHO15_08715 [Eubacteriales bacterium]|nr:hypothetical protein [Eubacteriales bacterium]